MTYEVNFQERRKEESRKKSIAFKAIEDHDESNDDDDINLMTHAFRNFIKNGKFRNFKDNVESTCFKYNKPGHIKTNCPQNKSNNKKSKYKDLLKQVGRMIHLLTRMKQICTLLQKRYAKLLNILNYFELSAMYIRS